MDGNIRRLCLALERASEQEDAQYEREARYDRKAIRWDISKEVADLLMLLGAAGTDSAAAIEMACMLTENDCPSPVIRELACAVEHCCVASVNRFDRPDYFIVKIAKAASATSTPSFCDLIVDKLVALRSKRLDESEECARQHVLRGDSRAGMAVEESVSRHKAALRKKTADYLEQLSKTAHTIRCKERRRAALGESKSATNIDPVPAPSSSAHPSVRATLDY